MANIAKIRFSAGHGIGSRYNRGGIYFNEGDENYSATGEMLKKLNERYYVDAEEIRREKGNYDHSFSDRSEYGRGADLFYSWHSNAGGGRGVEVILSYQSLYYYEFAKDLCSAISDSLGVPNRGVKFRNRDNDKFESYSQVSSSKRNWYGELYGNKAKCAVIVEHFFHDSESDSKAYLKNKEEMYMRIAKLIGWHFGLSKRSTSKYNSKLVNENWKVEDLALNIRQEPTSNSVRTGVIRDKGIYSISEVYGKWGKLSNGKGWIHFDFCKKLNSKSIKEVAKEVINGDWGNGSERKRRLTEAGYNYNEIQAEVSRII